VCGLSTVRKDALPLAKLLLQAIWTSTCIVSNGPKGDVLGQLPHQSLCGDPLICAPPWWCLSK